MPKRTGIQYVDAGVFRAMADSLRMLAHGDRLRIAEYLALNGPAPVHAICEFLGRPQAFVSNHLGKLRCAGLLSADRRGNEIWYDIGNPHCIEVLNCIRRQVGMPVIEVKR